jgi:predicted enzyme related to lactoylglutathione lyase
MSPEAWTSPIEDRVGQAVPSPVVHLELHTTDLQAACSFYSRLLGWREDHVHTPCGSYHALNLGPRLGGGMVECGIARSTWIPYVAVEHIDRATERAVGLGATVLLTPRPGPDGWRSVVATPEAGEVAMWQLQTAGPR